MSRLLEKSKFNIDAAEVLIKEYLYAPSVHCSYYSCLQRIKSILPDYYAISFSQIDLNVRTGTENEHGYLIRFISEEIRRNFGFEEYVLFKRNIGDLKEFRIHSDYKDIEITSDQSNKAYRKALDINKFLNEKF
ncbi:hypothetical protein Palpr_0880 [Paludibacter propionicigenes WB4]|uniref:HEPN domain-containing protein n=1 Tax=Paludibacter propionicigenes (strain DSM 17365 / JCM 13257 / WB4) TaxID=694427 RepID=E4T2T7_PALPW|nr:hypothetical protein [Paludibacter propionicigenes]ADQ79031.1 hypothetical protein Palpr_0880 [Paludibacter propionicigenes WB4]